MSEKERETVNSKIIDKAAEKYGEFLEALGFNWKKSLDMKDTPKRVAKMMVNDIFKSCYNSPPDVTTFKNKGYDVEIWDKEDGNDIFDDLFRRNRFNFFLFHQVCEDFFRRHDGEG